MTSTSEQPSEKSLELATRYVRMFKGDPAQHQNALNTLAIQFDEARKDGLKRAAEIAELRDAQNTERPWVPEDSGDWPGYRENMLYSSLRERSEIVAAILMEAGEKK